MRRSMKLTAMSLSIGIAVVLPAAIAFAEFFDPPAVSPANGNQNGVVANGQFEVPARTQFAKQAAGQPAGDVVVGNGKMVGNGRTHTYRQNHCPTQGDVPANSWRIIGNEVPVTEYDFTAMEYTFGNPIYRSIGVANRQGTENLHPDRKIVSFSEHQVPERNRVYWSANLEQKGNSITWGSLYALAATLIFADERLTTPLQKALLWQNAGHVPVCEKRINLRMACGDAICQPEEMLTGLDTCPEDCGNIPASVCGDGMIEGVEQCDAGNNNGTTRTLCSSTCMYVTGVDPYCGDGMCDMMHGEDATSCDTDCGYQNYCGNLICDAGETEITCPMDCTVSSSSSSSSAPPPPPMGFCGDLVVQAPETCDDGNITGGDGCDEMCQTE
ncbi:MAG: hypothetical protein HOO67_00645 [Candidatus Peribacteraceae bacterium]|nr:hypothetical protein [Candidatus Peribacteraceae bacterium]